jgi:hypothetical protein
MRRLSRYLVLPCLLLLLAPPARAQDSSEVLLRLIRQTPWNDPTHTSLSLDVRAVNRTSGALSDLSVGLTIFTPARSRSAYHQSLEQDPEGSSAILALVPPVTGEVGEGSSRTFHLSMDLTVLAQRDETAIYPMKVELRSHDRPVATLRSPVIFVSEPPKSPLDLTWTFVLSAPILYGPDGSFRTPVLERQVEHGGQIRAEVEALASLAARPRAPSVDVAIAPQLLEQLNRMRDGYSVEVDGERRQVPAGKDGAAAALWGRQSCLPPAFSRRTSEPRDKATPAEP